MQSKKPTWLFFNEYLFYLSFESQVLSIFRIQVRVLLKYELFQTLFFQKHIKPQTG